MASVFIINPSAGGGDRRFTTFLEGKWGELERVLGPLEVWKTEGPGHAEELARRAVALGASLIVAVGGDGTVHEVVNGITGSHVSLGIIPLGTGNDVARALRIPRAYPAAVELLIKGEPRLIDLGRAGNRYFVGVASAGFDAEVVAFEKKAPRFFKAYSAYALALLKAWRHFRPKPFTVEIEGRTFAFTGWMVAGANIPTYGGGLPVAPSARLDDGLLDFCLVGDLSRREVLGQAWKALRGRAVRHPKIVTFQARKAFFSGGPSLLQADGELLGPLPVHLEAVPRALRVIAPPLSLSKGGPILPSSPS